MSISYRLNYNNIIHIQKCSKRADIIKKGSISSNLNENKLIFQKELDVIRLIESIRSERDIISFAESCLNKNI